MLKEKDGGHVVTCDYCESSTQDIAGVLPTKDRAETVAQAFGFTMNSDYRHICPACRVSGRAR